MVDWDVGWLKDEIVLLGAPMPSLGLSFCLWFRSAV